MTDTSDEPSRPNLTSSKALQEDSQDGTYTAKPPEKNPDEIGALASWLRGIFKNGHQPESSLREALEVFIEDTGGNGEDAAFSEERALLSNILALRDLKVIDVMVPRADIVAVDISTDQADLFALLAERQYSRLPVYRHTLDDIVGTLHIKDVMSCLARNQDVQIKELVQDVPIISPSMPILDLMLEMRQSSRHMALVVDEYGGIDGLVTIGDVLEMIVGEFEDEHIQNEAPQMTEDKDGTLIIDSRLPIDEFETEFGPVFREEEREDNDTLAGAISAVAGRVPARGEIITHEASGMVVEIMDADPRRINKVRLRKRPEPLAQPDGDSELS